MTASDDAPETSPSLRVEMVCTGNICRSPMAEVILRELLVQAGLDERVSVSSSGTDGWHAGDGADPRTVHALEEHGYDGSAHVASQVEAASLEGYDLVLAADSGHVRRLRGLARTADERDRIHLLREWDPIAVAAGTLELDDPWYGGEGDFERCLREVERACRGLVDDLRTRLASGSGSPALS